MVQARFFCLYAEDRACQSCYGMQLHAGDNSHSQYWDSIQCWHHSTHCTLCNSLPRLCYIWHIMYYKKTVKMGDSNQNEKSHTMPHTNRTLLASTWPQTNFCSCQLKQSSVGTQCGTGSPCSSRLTWLCMHVTSKGFMVKETI